MGARSIAGTDYEATHAFVAIRHIWLIGQWASRTGEWGRQALSADWLMKELSYLQSWLRDRLFPALLDLQ
jgi:hypothetical protein